VESLSTQRIVSVACGDRHLGVLNASQIPLTLGSNEHFALGHSDDKPTPYRLPPRAPRGLGSAKIVQIACGATHSLLLSSGGQVYSMGSGVRGALGHGNRDDCREATPVAALACVPVRQVAAGDNFSVAVSATGLAYSWGFNKTGQCGLPVEKYPHAACAPVRVSGIPELLQHVACGEAHTMWVSRSGRVYAAGRNDCGQLGVGFPGDTSLLSPGAAAHLHSAGSRHALLETDSTATPAAVAAAAGASTTGAPTPSAGRSGVSHTPFLDVPTLLLRLQELRVREVACGRRHTLFLTADGSLYACGDSREAATGVMLPLDVDASASLEAVGVADIETAKPSNDTAESASAMEPGSGSTSPAPAASKSADAAGAVPLAAAPKPVPLLPGLRKVGTFSGLSSTPSSSFAPSSAGGGFGSSGRQESWGALAPAALIARAASAPPQSTQSLPGDRPGRTGSYSLVTAEEAEALRQVACLQSPLVNMDLAFARAGCLWAPTRIPGLSGIGIFRIAAGGDHSLLLRVTKGSVLSLPPGTLQPSAMPVTDAAALQRLAREASSSQHFVALKRCIREVFGSAGNLNASFLVPPAEDVTAAAARESGSAAPALLVFQAVAPTSGPCALPRRDAGGGAPHSRGQSAPTSDVPGMLLPAGAGAGSSGAGMAIDGQVSPALESASTGAGGASVPASAAADATEPAITAVAAPAESPSAGASGPPYAQPPPAKRRALDGERTAEAASGAGAGAADRPAAQTRGVSGSTAADGAAATVVIAPANTGPAVPAATYLKKSGIDVPALEAAYSAVLGTFDPDVTSELLRAHANCVTQVTAAAGRLQEADGLRCILTTLLSPVNSKATVSASFVAKLCAAILALPQASRDLLVDWVGADVPPALFASRLVGMLQSHLSYHLKHIISGQPYATFATVQLGTYDPVAAPGGSVPSAGAGGARAASAASGFAPGFLQRHPPHHPQASPPPADHGPASSTSDAGAAAGSGGGASDGSGGPGSPFFPAGTVLLTTLDGRVIGTIPPELAGLGGATLGSGTAAAGAGAPRGPPGAGTSAPASRGGGASASAGAGPGRPAPAATGRSAACPAPTFSVRDVPISHLYALELVVRVLRLLYNLNERLGQEAQAALLDATAEGQSVVAGIPSDTAAAAAPAGAGAGAGAAAAAGAGGSTAHAASGSSKDWSLSQAPLGMKVPPSAFYNADMQGIPDEVLQADYRRWAQAGYKRTLASPIILCGYPFLFDASTKRRLLMFESQMRQQSEAQNAIARSFLLGAESPYLILSVRRSNLMSDTLNQLVAQPASAMRKPLRVVFDGEEGIDEGGPRRELFQLLMKEVFDAKYGLFTYHERTREFWFNQSGIPGSEREYFLAGLLLGLAIYNSVTLDVHFPRFLYKKLLGVASGSLFDLHDVNPELASGLEKLLAYGGEDVEDVFCLNWEAAYEAFGEPHTVELCPGGKEKPVTAANKRAYVAAYVDWYLNKSIGAGFKEFSRGFVSVMSGPALMLFRPEELELLVAGTPHLDFKQLEAVATYDGGYHAAHPTIKALWRTIHSMTHEQQSNLLMFFSGCGKAPVGGLGKLPFKVQRAGPDSDRLPTASVCFGILLLPEYDSEAKLREKLLKAIEECHGFGLK